jgi:preprotein translocase subunit SecG
LLVSHGFLAATYLLLLAYVRQRFPDSPKRLPVYVLLALAFFPPTFFMRMAYPESMFVFLTLLAMYGMTRNWRLAWIAAIVGLATATRLVGVALLLPLSGYAWQSSGQGSAACVAGGARRVADTLHRMACVVVSIALGLSGLLAYMAYQWCAFGDPLAFAKTQDFWRHRVPDGLFDKILGLASWDPLWLAYIPGSPGYARLLDDPAPALISLQFANPVFFAGAVALVLVGAWKRWLSRAEIALAAGLILIPYAAKGFEMCMASQARFVAVAFPVYIVMGNILNRLPRPGSIAILAVFGTYLAIYSAMLAAGYVLI